MPEEAATIENSVPTTNSNIRYVSFSGEISLQTTESLIALFAQMVNSGVEEVHLLLSTPGGGVMFGLNLYNVLRAMPLTLITHNVGSVNSIGNAVFLAGEPRYACPHATFMFHGVGFDVPQGQRLDRRPLREFLDSIDADEKRISEILGDRTKLTREHAQELFREASTKDAAYAVSKGIVDEIRDVQIPPGGQVLALTFQR